MPAKTVIVNQTEEGLVSDSPDAVQSTHRQMNPSLPVLLASVSDKWCMRCCIYTCTGTCTFSYVFGMEGKGIGVVGGLLSVIRTLRYLGSQSCSVLYCTLVPV